MRISTLCNICYIVVSRELLYVFLQKLLHYLNKFTNRHRVVCQRQLSFLFSTWDELILIFYQILDFNVHLKFLLTRL